MIIGIMQPYFLPGPGYFDLIAVTDRWIVFDTPQYRRHGWMNRNRVLRPDEGWQYVTVPLQKHGRDTPIRDMRVDDGRDWRERIPRQLAHYRKRAPFYDETMALVDRCLAAPTDSLVGVDVHALARICDHLDLEFRCDIFSDLELELGPVEGPGDWALRICEAVGASAYVNPPGGRDLFDPERYASCGVSLHIREPPPLRYDTPGYSFEPGLSVVDALMWLGADGVKAWLADAGAVPLIPA